MKSKKETLLESYANGERDASKMTKREVIAMNLFQALLQNPHDFDTKKTDVDGDHYTDFQLLAETAVTSAHDLLLALERI